MVPGQLDLRCVVVTAGSGVLDAILTSARQALSHGATAVWLRERQRSDSERRVAAETLRKLCDHHGAGLIVAGDVELAIACRADAVHLGFRDERIESVRARCGHRLLLGFSAHDTSDPRDHDAIAHADYVTLSPFATTPKDQWPLPPLGAQRFREVRASLACPVVALGGIDATNAAAAIAAGADGVAVRRAITDIAAIRVEVLAALQQRQRGS